MFHTLSPGQADPILSLSAACQADQRREKIDLGVGVYRDEQGLTPVMRAVTEAQQQLLQTEVSKAYVGIVGYEAFNESMLDMLIGKPLWRSRCRAIQTPGASGALRLAAELLVKANPKATVWLSDPSYANHGPIMRAVGLKVASYRYFDPQSKRLNLEGFYHDMRQVPTGDVVLLHGCCHNPTGVDLSLEAWQFVTDGALDQGFLPFIDVAYQGFAEGLEADVLGLRYLLDQVPEAIVVASCSKHFGLYRERTGVAMVLGQTPTQAQTVLSQWMQLARASYTMAPDHGARLVATIWQDAAHLRPLWLAELEQMRLRVQGLREQLREALAERTGSGAFDFLSAHRGMFSVIGIEPKAVQRLREQHAIYMLDTGRINLAGLRQSQVEPLADALVDVIS